MSADVNFDFVAFVGNEIPNSTRSKKVILLKGNKKCVKCGYLAPSINDLWKHLLFFEVTLALVIHE